jgi:hypothetical protein
VEAVREVYARIVVETERFAAAMRHASDVTALVAWRLDTGTLDGRDARVLSPPVLDAWADFGRGA